MNDASQPIAVGPGEGGAPADEADTGFMPPGISAVPREPEPLSHGERRLIAISMMLPVFLGSIDQSILASALPTIGRVFGNVQDLAWLVTSYLIAATAMTPLYGKFADIHGRRASLLIALGLYVTGSLISTCSVSMLMLICGRVVQGLGGGGMISGAQMVLGDIAAPKDRAKYYVYFSIAFTTAGGCGPALGGWICDHLAWWVIFAWQIPLCFLAVIIVLTVLRRLPRYGKPHQLDIVGAILIMAASSSFMLALNLGGVRYPWLSATVLELLTCALVLGAALVVRVRTAAEPLIPITILTDPTARLAIAAHAFGWGSIIGLIIFLPTYLQSALGWSATASGLSLMTLTIMLNASAGFSSLLVGRVRHYKIVPLCCLLVGIGAIFTLAFSPDGMSSLHFEIILILIGAGFGPTAPLTQVILQNTVPPEHLGAAIGTINFARTLSGTIVVAVFGAIVLSRVDIAAPSGGLNPAALSGASAAAFANVFLTGAVTLTVCFVVLILVQEKPLVATLPSQRL